MRLSHLFRPRHAIASSLAGGLGNQLFQYAFGRSIAIAHNCELILDSRILLIKENQTQRDFALSAFNIKATVDTLNKKQLDRCISIKEIKSNYDPTIFKKTGPGCRLTGYWQSEKYFSHIRRQLLEELTLKEPTSSYISKMADHIKMEPNSVSIHFRRGDYVNDAKVAAFHGSCSQDYYQRSIENLKEKLSNPHFFLFSDDPQWMEENAPKNIPSTIIDSNKSSAHEDLWLMSLCKNHIIANSSFSWWGAWLGSQDGLTYAPGRWFLSPSFNDSDIVPTRWSRI